MDEAAQIEYFARSMVQFTSYFALQMHAPNMVIDNAKILAAFACSGKPVAPWPLGPSVNASTDTARVRTSDQWADQSLKRGALMPSRHHITARTVKSIVREGGKNVGGRSADKKRKTRPSKCIWCNQLNWRSGNGEFSSIILGDPLIVH